MITEQKQNLTAWNIQQAKNSRHRALIMQILKDFPLGLTTQQLIEKEKDYYGYTFLTDNRLRECKQRGWVRKSDDVPAKWIPLISEDDCVGAEK